MAAALALAVGEVIAWLSPVPVSLAEAVGGLVIDFVPPPVKDFAIAVFGFYDKLALIIGMVLVTVLLGRRDQHTGHHSERRQDCYLPPKTAQRSIIRLHTGQPHRLAIRLP